MSLKKIDGNITRITTNSAKLNVLIHQTAMMILTHANGRGNGDATRALYLVQAMPASMRRTTLIAWFHKYSPIRITLKPDTVSLLKKGDPGFTAFDLAKADANPFYEIAEKVDETPALLDFEKFIGMITAIANREKAKVDEGKVKPEDAPSIVAACDLLANLKFERVAANDEGEGAGEDTFKLAAVA